MATGGIGKQRMRRDATLKPSHSWRVIVLSSGEFPIETKLNEDPKHGARAHAGQLVRAVDIPVCGVHGVFDAFEPDDVDPSAFAEKCKNATSAFYGMAGPEFVRQLIAQNISAKHVREHVDAFVQSALRDVKDRHGQAARVVTERMLRTDASAVAGRLTSLGMFVSGISAEQRAALEYLMLEFPISERVTKVRSTGWIEIDGQRAFVLPSETIGASGSERVVPAEHIIGSPYAQHGTLEDWREAIAKPAGDHLMMRLSISTSLAGPLLDLGGFESGILHFWGSSSRGKTTMQRIAASSWGSGADGGYMSSWRTTANALEGTLASMTDTSLVLDELAQAAGHEIGAVVYMITGSVGKTRMRRDSSIRSPYKWRVLALSSGETSMAARIGEDQKVKRAHAGQLVRALDIPAKRALGMFDQVRPNFDAEAFAKEMQAAASTYYGTAGPQFVRELIERCVTSERLRKLTAEFVAVALKGVNKSNHGQVARMAERFGLIAVAGKLATEFGIVSWPRRSSGQ
jgi:putative DNA primase/helicase